MDHETEQTFRGMNSVIMNLAIMFTWAVCALFHVTLVVIFLIVVWFLEIDKAELQTALTNFYHQHKILPNLVSTLGVAGLVLLAWVWFYIKMWKKAFAMFLAHYVWKDVE